MTPRKADGAAPAFWTERRRIVGLCLASRSVFAAVLVPWFLIGGLSGLGGLSLSMGPTVPGLPLSLGAYMTHVPGRVGDISDGLSEFGVATQAYVGLMVLGELVLPVLIVAGWLARPAAWLLALHQTIVYLPTFRMPDAGAAFDASPFDMTPDIVLLWLMLIAPVALFGAGPLSIDAIVVRWKGRRG